MSSKVGTQTWVEIADLAILRPYIDCYRTSVHNAVQCMVKKSIMWFVMAGRLGEAGAELASSGDVRGAVRLWLRGGRARRAAALILQQPSLLRDNELVETVHAQLIQVTDGCGFQLRMAVCGCFFKD